MLKFNYWFVLGIINISIITGMAIDSVGEIPTCGEEPYTWYMPIQICIGFLLPFVLGYFAGKDDTKERDDKNA